MSNEDGPITVLAKIVLILVETIGHDEDCHRGHWAYDADDSNCKRCKLNNLVDVHTNYQEED